MSHSLIINARHRLPWHQRLFSDASTAMAWGGWLWLWAPLLRPSAIAELGLRTYPTLLNVLAGGSVENVQHSVLALVGTSGTLMVWNRLPGRRARNSGALEVRDYARHFDLPEERIEAGRDASVCVVHHDDSGRIIDLECRVPRPPGSPSIH